MRGTTRYMLGALVVAAFTAMGLRAASVAASAGETSAPIGALDVASVLPDSQLNTFLGAQNSLHVSGWALDADSATAIKVHVYLNGTFVAEIDAGRSRADVGAAYPTQGALHGYDVTLPLALPGAPQLRYRSGDNVVCTYGIDAGSDANALLGCHTVTVGRSPVGSLDVVAGLPDGLLRVAGWTIDPDTVSPNAAHVYVDGVYTTAVHAGGSRGDVGAAFPAYGDGHGFDVVIPNVNNGTHTVCVYGIDLGIVGVSGGITYASNPLLGCRSVTISGNPIEVRGASPIGALDVVTSTPDGVVRVAGWAIDPDTAAAINVNVYVDGNLMGGIYPADRSRSDVGAAYPLYGPLHGYDLNLGPPRGIHNVCTYGIDTATKVEALLGCKAITN